ncbi:hypothetical protein GJ744_004178 [Endocarpon pusillum]|uniref:Uncharacterized protein n=1 Tax=Endocarpon pusillum TaxID=364733 RepID=A0A8H7ALW4_9EURO|nr:hypothetical protein GJ744_004178 [Endocarpon pusillum]
MIDKKSVLITGCSGGGIGGALALVFQQRGYHVFATARTTSKMSALAQLPNVTLLTLDVTNTSHIAAAVNSVTRGTGGTLDYLINNSGRNHFSPILDLDMQEAKRLYDTNVWGSVAVIKGFAPLIIKAKGTIANITSISGHVNVPWMGTYAASKRSLEIISETLRLELSPFGVTVLSVVTGAVKTNGQTYFGDWKLPEDSIYKPIEAKIASRAQGHDGVKRMETMDYAKKVVNDIEAGASGKVWRGSTAGAVRFGSVFLPQSLMDSSLVKGTGLPDLPKAK